MSEEQKDAPPVAFWAVVSIVPVALICVCGTLKGARHEASKMKSGRTFIMKAVERIEVVSEPRVTSTPCIEPTAAVDRTPQPERMVMARKPYSAAPVRMSYAEAISEGLAIVGYVP